MSKILCIDDSVDTMEQLSNKLKQRTNSMIVTDKAFLEQPSRETSLEECKMLNIFDVLAQELAMSPIKGCGLAAVQIGQPIRASIMVTDKRVYRMVNPVIISQSEPIVSAGEGCLSAQGKTYNCDRFNKCTVKYIDYDDGLEHTAETDGFNAIVLQHELDHFDGILNYKRECKPVIKQGRNELCACKSGKKHKKCCLK
jgi:peptide deformylase